MTHTVELKVNRTDGKARQVNMPGVGRRHRGYNINHFAAFLAVRVLMWQQVAFKAPNFTSILNPGNFTLFSKQIKIAVERAQADTRQALAHYGVQLICGWMRV
jgi:hypothetical protein